MENKLVFIGTVLYEIYYNEDSLFGVYNVRTENNIPYSKKNDIDGKQFYIITVSGKIQQLSTGCKYQFSGEAENSKYGWGYKISDAIPIAPKTYEDSKVFLEYTVTKYQAESLLKAYPNIINEVINGTDDVDVSKVKYIGYSTWNKIKNKIVENFRLSDLIKFLHPYGIPIETIKRMASLYESTAQLINDIKTNPYLLLKLKGFGWERVDSIALKINPELLKSKIRLIELCKYVLSSVAENEGDTYLKIKDLYDRAYKYVPQTISYFNDLFVENNNELSEHGLFYYKGIVSLCKYFKQEGFIYHKLIDINNYKFLGQYNPDEGIQEFNRQTGFTLTDEQELIVRSISNNNILIFTGSAGTGKSSTARAILNSFVGETKIGCCSLSAKAAQRIKESTGFEAKTIHRILGFDGKRFMYNKDNKMPYDVVFVDEASMINTDVLSKLLSAIKDGAKLIMCGDNKQLPPIGSGNIFSDILNMNCFNVYKLTKVHRQAEKSGILSDANKIRKGISPIENIYNGRFKVTSGENEDMKYYFFENADTIKDYAIKIFIQSVEKFGIDSINIAVPRKDKVINSALELSKGIQKILFEKDYISTPVIKNKRNDFFVGDRIVQLENDNERNVFNGEIGIITDINITSEDWVLKAEFPCDDNKVILYNKKQLDGIALAYALSVHKLQGSENKNIIVVMDNSHYILLDTCLTYTAITRAKERCFVLTTPTAFKKAMNTNRSETRHTWLSLYGTELFEVIE